jgi:hypothetical protein
MFYKIGIRTIMTENIIGLWKRKFPNLKLGIRTKVSFACDIIVATAVLHNLAVRWNEPDPGGENVEENPNGRNFIDVPREAMGIAQRTAGQQRRGWLSENFC